MKKGKVYLVGAGPGDPGLITVKGLECLMKAEVVIYDRLLDDRLLEAVRPGVKKIYAGKKPQHHTIQQPEINRIIVDEAKKGKVVVRLKGGDPFVFGRGGEEAEALAENNIPFEVVPGVTSAIAAPAYAGIPVTLRGLASSFSVITGHSTADRDIESIAWSNIAASTGTLVFLMGIQNLSRIVEKLVENGKPLSEPAALIANGTSPLQKTVTGTLGNIVMQAEQSKIDPPAILVVGKVVNLRESINWFDSLPLFGKRVLITRPKRQAGQLSRLLTGLGAMVVEAPSIKIQAITETGELDEAITNTGDYRWIFFTSVNGVEAFFERLKTLGLDSRRLSANLIGAI
ncbi:uroporphyrinogen-III C-methyltransferase, partial [Chloroflexota bacterium]